MSTKILNYLALILFVCITSCNGQQKVVTPQKKSLISKGKIYADSISTPAYMLPEFLIDAHDTTSQGNQIFGIVRTMLQDKNGNFWFGGQGGLSRYDGKSLLYYDLKKSIGQGITVKAIVQDKYDNIWIGHSGGITKYDGKYFTNFSKKEGLVSNDVWSLATDNDGTVWIGTLEGVNTFDGAIFTPFDIPDGEPDHTRGVTSAKIVHQIMEDSQKRMWFGTNGGAYIYNGNTLSNVSKKDGLPSNFVNGILEGKNGSYWITTSNHGLFFYDGKTITNVTKNIHDDGKKIGSAIQDSKGNIWFHQNLRNLYLYDGKEFTKYQIENGDLSPSIFQIYEDQQNRMWFLGLKGAYRYDSGIFVNITRDGPW